MEKPILCSADIDDLVAAQNKKRSQKKRIKLLIVGACLAALNIFFIWALFIDTQASFHALADHGTATTAIVSEYNPVIQKRQNGRYTEHFYKIIYDGHVASKNLFQADLIGRSFPVLYLPEDTSKVVLGSKGESAKTLFLRDKGGTFYDAVFVLILFILGALVGASLFFFSIFAKDW